MKRIPDLKHSGSSYNVRHVASLKKADFIADASNAIPDMSEADNKAALGQIHDECTALVKTTDAPPTQEVSAPVPAQDAAPEVKTGKVKTNP